MRVFAALLAYVLFSTATAQTATFYLEDLLRKPATVYISPNYLTVIEVPQKVMRVSTGRPDLFKVEVSRGNVYIATVSTVGTTDLLMEVGPQIAQFKVVVTRGSGPRRYVVAAEKPIRIIKKNVPKRAPPKQVARPKPRPVKATPKPSIPVARGKTPLLPATKTTTSNQIWLATKGPRVNNPDWVGWTVLRQSRIGSEVTLMYAIQNNGNNPILFNPTNLRVLSPGGGPIKAAHNQTRSILIAPRSTHLGKFTLTLRAERFVNISLSLQERVTLRVLSLERSVNVNQL
jgi:hypothetical protein